jgi:hypothetical protein
MDCRGALPQNDFYGLDIQILNSTIIKSARQKSMSLYLYIPSLSVHQPSCFKGLITGELRWYWIVLFKFITRLMETGYTLETWHWCPQTHTVIYYLIQAYTRLKNIQKETPCKQMHKDLLCHSQIPITTLGVHYKGRTRQRDNMPQIP